MTSHEPQPDGPQPDGALALPPTPVQQVEDTATPDTDAAPAWTIPRPRPAPAASPLVLALVAALLGYALTRGVGSDLGINVALWVSLWGGGLLWLTARRGQQATPEGRTLLGVALAFALTFAVWDAPTSFQVLNLLALGLALVLSAAVWRHPGLARAATGRLMATAISGGLRLASGTVTLLERFPWTRLRSAPTQPVRPWLTGLALTLPVLLVFGALLAGADSGFEQLVSGLWRWNPERLLLDGLSLSAWTLLTAGLSYPALMALSPSLFSSAPLEDHETPSGGRLGLIEAGMPLVALTLLFLVFLSTQLPYFLSGMTLPEGLTFAEYVRRGFSELLWVAGLTLALLLAAYGLTRPEVRRQASYRLMNLGVLLPLVLVLLSAANRWRLYTAAYGLSEIRVLGAALLVWLLLTLAWLGVCVWREQLRRFAYPALLAGFGVLLGTTLLNPGRLIASVHLHRDQASVINFTRSTPQQANVWHLLDLGTDAAPLVVRHLPELTEDCRPDPSVSDPSGTDPGCPASRSLVIERLKERYGQPRDLRVWNSSHERARQAVATLDGP